MFADQFRKAVLLAWLVVANVSLAISVSPFVVPQAALLSWAPVCESKARYARECPLCGMTTSFIALSSGDLAGAYQANRAGPALWLLLLLNGMAGAVVLLRRIRRARTRKEAQI